MKVPVSCKLEKAVSKDELRPALNHLNLRKRGDQWILEATSGHVYAYVPVELDSGDIKPDPEQNLIPVAALTEGRKSCGPRDSFFSIILKEKEVVYPTKTGTATAPRPEGQRFPRTESIIPDLSKYDFFRVAFNYKLLNELAQALGPNAINNLIELQFTWPDYPGADYAPHALIMQASNPDAGYESFGLLMPIRMDEACIPWQQTLNRPCGKVKAPARLRGDDRYLMERDGERWKPPEVLIPYESAAPLYAEKPAPAKKARRKPPEANPASEPAPTPQEPQNGPPAAPEPAAEPAPAPTEAESKALVTFTLNPEKKRLEVRAPEGSPVIERLKAARWIFNKEAGCWINRITPDNQTFAESLAA